MRTRSTEFTATIPEQVIAAKDKLALVEFLRAHGATGAVDKFDWPGDGEAFHVSFKSPRAQCDADISLPDGQTHLTVDTHGVPGLITRLHTAKEAGPVWRLFLDATAILLLLVCFTGLILWQSLPKRRLIGSMAMVLSLLAIGLAYWVCVPWR